MQVLRAMNSYQRTRSGLVVTGLVVLGMAVACLAAVLAMVGWNDGAFVLLAIGLVCLGWFVQNVVRLVIVLFKRDPSASPLPRFYRRAALLCIVALGLFIPVSLKLVTVPTIHAIEVSAGSACQRGSGLGGAGSCLCIGVGLLPLPGNQAVVPVGFPFTIQEDVCGSGYLGDTNVLAACLDLLVAAATSLLIAGGLVYGARRVGTHVQAG